MYIYVTWLFLSERQALIYMCDMTHSHARQDSFPCVVWQICIGHMTTATWLHAPMIHALYIVYMTWPHVPIIHAPAPEWPWQALRTTGTHTYVFYRGCVLYGITHSHAHYHSIPYHTTHLYADMTQDVLSCVTRRDSAWLHSFVYMTSLCVVMSHDTHSNESWVMSRMPMNRVTYANESCHTWEWIMSHMGMHYGAHVVKIPSMSFNQHSETQWNILQHTTISLSLSSYLLHSTTHLYAWHDNMW